MLNSENGSIIVALIGVGGAVLAALIAGVISLIVQGRQLKREGKMIDSISSDTSDMKPKIDSLDRRAEKQADKIDVLVADVEYRKRLKSEVSANTMSPDMLLANMNKVFDQNAWLNTQYQQAQERIMHLSVENNRLQAKVASLEKDLAAERSRNRPRGNRGDDYER